VTAAPHASPPTPVSRPGPPPPLAGALLVLMLASALGQAVGAARGYPGVAILAAFAFVGALLHTGWRLDAPWWSTVAPHDIGPCPAGLAADAAERNGRLTALAYLWGAVSLAAVYLGTPALAALDLAAVNLGVPVRWQHGWQYAAGMAVIAAGVALATRGLARRWSPALRDRLVWVTLLHGWAALAGLAWLILSAKLFSVKPDWPANVVFAGGATAIAGLGALGLRTSRLLAARR
jgi:hypothetical protein